MAPAVASASCRGIGVGSVPTGDFARGLTFRPASVPARGGGGVIGGNEAARRPGAGRRSPQPPQTGVRFSKNAPMPSAASRSRMFRTITSEAYAYASASGISACR